MRPEERQWAAWLLATRPPATIGNWAEYLLAGVARVEASIDKLEAAEFWLEAYANRSYFLRSFQGKEMP